jgi:transcription initiation factor TFIIIB Brf1 subunit/transcription initiation factor TFIIB
MDYECNHDESLIVHDTATGERICSACGLVLEAYMFDDRHHTYYCAHSSTTPIVPDILPDSAKRSRKIREHVESTVHHLRLPENVVNVALSLLQEALESKAYRLRNAMMDVSAASLVYFACKILDIDRAEIELVVNCGLSPKTLSVSNKNLRRALGASQHAGKIHHPINPVRLIPRFLQALTQQPSVIDIPQVARIRTCSEDIARKVTETGVLEGKSPECCCIAIISQALLDTGFSKATIEDVCTRCGLTSSTIHNALALMNSHSYLSEKM